MLIEAQISAGTYEIGPTGDYLTLSAAVDSLISQGLAGDGNVIFNIQDGTYDDGITFGTEITGVSATSTLTFQSKSLDASKVIIQTSTRNNNFSFTACDYIAVQYLTIKNLNNGSIARAFYLGGAATNITIKHNIIWGYGSSTTSSNYANIFMDYSGGGDFDNLVVDSNMVNDGSYFLYLSTSNSNVNSNCKIRGNTVTNYAGISIDSFDGVEISGNTLNVSANSYGIRLDESDLEVKILNNKINLNYTYTSYGIALYTCASSGGAPALVANNAIFLNGGTGVQRYGIYENNSQYYNFYYNTITINEGASNSYAFYAYNGANITLSNNILSVEGLGIAIGASSKDPNIITQSDYNDLYTAGNYLGDWEGILTSELADWQSASSLDAHSISVYPNFKSTGSLIATTQYLDNAGNDVGIATDLLGNSRTDFDIGAYVYEPANTLIYNSDLTIKPGGGGTFTSFTEAIDSLVRLGISAPVTITVDDGTYPEHIVIRKIPGASTVNTILFKSASADSSMVSMVYSSTADNNNYVVKLYGADYITFKQITLENDGTTKAIVMEIDGHAINNQVQNCVLKGTGIYANTVDRAVVYSPTSTTDNFTIKNSVIQDGSYGIYLNSPGTTDYTTGLSLTGNTFTGHYHNIYIQYFTNFEINNNNCNEFYQDGIRISNCISPYSIYKNKISSTTSLDAGIMVSSCTGTGNGGLIYNNFVSLSLDNTYDAVYGISLYNSTYQSIYYNSFNVVSTCPTSSAFYYYNSGGPTSNNLKLINNSLANDGPGYSVYSTLTGIFANSDYNNFYTGGLNLMYISGTNYATVASMPTDAHSMNYNPVYDSFNDLHTHSYWLDGAGTPVALVTQDIDGNTRDGLTPDIGASEYTSGYIPLSGTYTIGAGGDFTSFTQAIDTLVLKGMLDTVIFNVLEGTYSEHFIIPQIAGSGPGASIIIQSDGGNTTSPIISYTASNATDNYVIKVDGTDYLTIKGLTIQSGASQYANLLVLSGTIDSVSIENNAFIGRTTSSSGSEDALIFANGSIMNYLKITGNTFSNGSYGNYLNGNSTTNSEGLTITGNTYNSYYEGIYLAYFNAPYVDGNVVNLDYYDGIGINVGYCYSSATSGLRIVNNQIYSKKNLYSYGAIYLYSCDANSSYPGILANNVVQVGSKDANRSYAIQINSSDYISLYYNSVNVTNTSNDNCALYCQSSANLKLKNNNFAIFGEKNIANPSKGWAIYLNSSCSVSSSDYNNFYSSGRQFAYWLGTAYSTMASLKAASLQDAHSISVFPAYLADINLKTISSWIDGKGTPVAGFTTDMEGNSRDASTPDIGAYEFSTTETPLAAGSYSVGSGAMFPTLDSVVSALMEYGISGPVTFELNNGYYTNTSVMLKDVPGASPADSIIFRSKALDASKVSILYTQDVNNNFIFYLNGTDYLTFNDLTFTSGGTSYSTMIKMDGNAHHININGNKFNGYSTSSNDFNKSSIYVPTDEVVDYINISNNTFIDNSLGIWYKGWTSYNLNQLVVENNQFNNQYLSVYFDNTDGPKVRNNVVSNFKYMGIYFYYCDESLEAVSNSLTTTNDNGYAISLYSCNGTAADQGLIANNMIALNATGNYTDYGIKIDYSNYERVYYNTVSITSPGDGSSIYIYNGGNNYVMNNIMSNTGGGYAYYVNNTTAVLISENNDIYTKNTNNVYAYYNGAQTSLSALQAASSKDAGSVNAEPEFISTSDLHMANDNLMELAFALSDVTTDFDGELRDASTPDIGADEMVCNPVALTISNFSICQSKAVVMNHQTYQVAKGAIYYWDFNGNGFNDDTTYTYDTIIQYMYNTAGSYNAKLTLHQLGGCQSQSNFTVTVNATPGAPTVLDTTIGCFGQDIPPLVATGTNIKWYSDTLLTNLLYTNDSLITGNTELGSYSYFATQTQNSCESGPIKATLTIAETPDALASATYEICQGDLIPTLMVDGMNVKWYADENLTDLLIESNEYQPDVTEPGTYTYFVTQTSGECESNGAMITFIYNQAPVIDAVISPIDCKGHDFGTINLTVTGGNGPYIYNWSNGKTTQDITNLAADWYTVTVKDLNGCSSVDSFEITAPDPIILSVITNDADCGEANGSATVTAGGGQQPYTYRWTTGDSTVMIENLASGTYLVTVTDHLGCSEFIAANVNDLGGPVITVDGVQNVTCYGQTNGAISLSVAGGSLPYTYNWSNGANTEDINNLAAGPYDIQVADANNCKSIKSFNVTQPDAILIDLNVFNANCGQSNGSAVANVSGGTLPFSYSWSTGSASENISGLNLGVYRVTITDDNSCTAVKSFAVAEIGAPTVYIDSVIQGTCGNQDGAIYITAYGAAGDVLDYLWNNGAISEDLVGVNPGEYSVTVADTAGCSGAAVTTIEADKPETPSICIVSVDTVTNYNEIVWEKPVTDQVDHYNIYRESTQSGVYLKVGENPYTDESIFVDENSNAKQRSYRYKISSADVCGVESDLSTHHKTMHLTVNLGLNNSINLIWDQYEGFDISTYYIYRHTQESGWQLYDSIPSNLTSYTDFDAPLEELSYYIEITNPYGCTATKATNRNTGRSNVRTTVNTGSNTTYKVGFHVSDGAEAIQGAEITFMDNVILTDASGIALFEGVSPANQIPYSVSKTGYSDLQGTIDVVDKDVSVDVILIPVGINQKTGNGISLYPNPNDGQFYLKVDLSGISTAEYQLFNSQGRELSHHKLNNDCQDLEEKISIPNQIPGIYFLRIIIDNESFNRRIVVK